MGKDSTADVELELNFAPKTVLYSSSLYAELTPILIKSSLIFKSSLMALINQASIASKMILELWSI